MKVLFILITFILTTLIIAGGSPIQEGFHQLIWYISHTSGTSPNYNFYYQIGMRNTRSDYEGGNNTPLTDYQTIVRRFSSDNYMDFTITVKPGMNSDLKRLTYFMIESNGKHRDDLAYVLWDLTMGCGCYSTFNIKFFKCNTEAKTYFDSLSNTNRKLKYRTVTPVLADEYGLKLLPSGEFRSNDELKAVLDDYPTCYTETSTPTNCCLPYACWLNFGSPQCVCGLDRGTGAGFVGGYGADCWCSFTEGATNCSQLSNS